MSAGRTFEVGDRVRLEGHWEFPDDTMGTIMASTTERRKSVDVPCYWVRFDEPTDDGSGDGPYGTAVIDGASLRLLT